MKQEKKKSFVSLEDAKQKNFDLSRNVKDAEDTRHISKYILNFFFRAFIAGCFCILFKRELFHLMQAMKLLLYTEDTKLEH